MSDEALLTAMRDLVQEDVAGRGLRTDPDDNLITACPGDFAAACRSIAATPRPVLAIVTGFHIAHADPPCQETDGPLGAVFLARALAPLGIPVVVMTEPEGLRALGAGLKAAKVRFPLTRGLPLPADDLWLRRIPTHLIAIERAGPGADDRCRNMRGRDITAETAPAHGMFEETARQASRYVTIGIGDGGNEIGMGKITWDTIRRNVPNGARIACRVPTDRLIVAGVSNWGAYALAAGVRLLRGAPDDPALWDAERERELLEIMVERGPLVDGTTGKRIAQVDGLPWDRYASVLVPLGEMLASR